MRNGGRTRARREEMTEPTEVIINTPLPGDFELLRVSITYDSGGLLKSLSVGLISPESPDSRWPLDALELPGEALPYLRSTLDMTEAIVAKTAALAPHCCDYCSAPLPPGAKTYPWCEVCGIHGDGGL